MKHVRSIHKTPFAFAVAALVLPAAAGAQTAITIGKITGGIGIHIPSYVAMDKGFFKEEGLDARFIELGGSAMIRAGLTNNLQFVPIPSGGTNCRLLEIGRAHV